MKLFSKKESNRWLVLDQSFFTMFITYSLIGSVMNIVLDLAAVFLGLGTFGIGLATSVGQYIWFGYLLLHFRSQDSMLRFVPLDTGVKEMLGLLSKGTEKALRRLGNVIRPVLVNRLIIFYGGALAMTAMSVESNLCEFTQFFPVGLADAAAVVYVVLCAFVLGVAFGAYGVLVSFLVSDFLCLVTVWIYYAIKTHRLIPTPEAYMALPENFH